MIQTVSRRHRTAFYAAAWVVAQSGGLMGIAANWENSAGGLVLTALYTVLNLLVIGGILWQRAEGIERLVRRYALPPRALWLLMPFGLLAWIVPLRPDYPLD